MEHISIAERVQILAYEHPEWVPILEACIAVARRSDSSRFAGSWVHAELSNKGNLHLPNNLRLLVRVGLLEKSGESVRGGHRAYYELPDVDEVAAALEALSKDGGTFSITRQSNGSDDQTAMQGRISQIESPDYFTELCQSLLDAEYHDFMVPDDSRGDGGNDGYSEIAETLFQFYCPTKPERMAGADYVSRIRKKIRDDLDKAKRLSDSGEYRIKNWIFITPRALREPEQTYIRTEAAKRGFTGTAWASIKLSGLLAGHTHLRSQFPTLILPDIEAQLEAVSSKIDGQKEGVSDATKTYQSKREQMYKRRIDDAKVPLDDGKWATAKKEYELILKDIEADPDPIDPHLRFRVYNNLGVSEMNLNNHEQAAALFEKAYEAEPTLPMAIGKFALSKLFKDKPEEGLPIIDSVLEENPDDDHLISVKANLLYGLKNYSDLIPFLRSKGKVALAHWYEGFDRMERKDYDGACASFEAVLRIEPKNVRAMMLVTQNVMVGMQNVVRDNPFPADKIPPEIKDKFLRAIECLNNAIKILKDSEHKEDLEMAYANLSGCYVAIGANDDAIKAAGDATALDPNSAVPFLNKGIAQLRRGDFSEAIEAFNTYKELGGSDVDVDRHIAFCALRTGNLDDAGKIVAERLESEDGLDLDVAELAIDLYSRKLDNEKLLPILERLEKEFPTDPQALRIRSLYMQRRGIDGSEALIRKALANAKTMSEKILAETDLADFYYNQKDYERAAEIYKKYLNTEESDQATRRYADCLYSLGRYGALLEWLDTLSTQIREDAYISQVEAYANLYLGNLDLASKIFKKLFEKHPGELQHLVFYGMCRFRLGKEDETRAAYDAIKNRVTSTQDLIILAGAYEGIGEWKTAIELAFKALEDDPNNPKAHLAFIFTFLRREQAEGEVFEDKHIKAFQKSIGEFNQRFPEETALRGFEVKDNDISEILKVVDQMVEVTDNATNLYKESKAPMAFVPKLTGKNPFDVWAAFTNMPDVGVRMSFGAPDELPAEVSVIENVSGASVVIDIYPLFLLGYLDQLDLITKCFKKAYVHQSVLDELTEAIEDRKISSRKGLTVLGKADGKHRMDEIPPEQVKKALDLFEKIKDFLTNNDGVSVRGLSKEQPKENRDIIDALHESTRDSILLAHELNVPFYCDDRILRAVLQREQHIQSFSTQGLFLTAQKTKLLTLEERFELQKKMIEFNYGYISIDAAFVLTQLKKASYNAEDLDKIISVLVQKETNIQSLATVLADLFFAIMLDQSVDSGVKVKAFAYILQAAKPNHNLEALEEGMFVNLQKRIRPERRDELRDMIKLIFLSAST